MLKLIINPLDDLAMLGVLRSPLTGVSDNTLYWLRQRAGGDDSPYDPIWPTLSSPDRLEHVDGEDRNRISGFVDWLEAMRQAAGRLTLRRLVSAIINHGDYAAMMAAGPDGRQDLANLLKLLDLAGDYEISRGNDLKQFTDFLEHQKETEVREIEAPTEEEGVDAVRIMTMHSAKGLEFPLVVLPNLQASGRGNWPDIMLDQGDGRRIGMNFKTNGHGGGEAFDYGELKQEAFNRKGQEGKRLGYVAMTRARKHLILSGVAKADRLPGGNKKIDSPFDWIQNLLQLRWDRDENLGDADRIENVNGTTVGLRICTDPEGAAGRYIKAQEKQESQEPAGIDPKITKMPEAAVYVPPSISPTALDVFHACPRRYYLERVLRAGEALGDKAPGRAATAGGELSATVMGQLVHKILEDDLQELQSGPVDDDLLEESARQVVEDFAGLSSADRNRARELIENFRRTAIAGDLFSAASAGILKRELGFSTLVGQTILQGQMDAYVPMSVGTLVVDYKTGSPGKGRTVEEAADSYRYQMASYALAALRMNPGPVRVVLVYLGGNGPKECIKLYETEEIPSLEDEIGSMIDSMAAGDFPAIARFDEHQCPWCIGGPDGADLCSRTPVIPPS